MQKLAYFIFLTVSLNTAFCQHYNFFRQYNTIGYDLVYGFVEVEDGFIIGGHSNSDINPLSASDDPGVYFAKIDYSGNKVWEKIYRNNQRMGIEVTDFQFYYQTNALMQSPDNTIVAVGGNLTDEGLVTPIVYKIDYTGDTIWSFRYPLIKVGAVESSFPVHSLVDKDGNIIVLCKTSPLNITANRDRNELIKISPDGKLLWGKKINITFRLFHRAGFIPNKKQYALFGNIYFHDSSPPHPTISDTASALLIDSSGNIIEDKILYYESYPDNTVGEYTFFQVKQYDTCLMVAHVRSGNKRSFNYFDNELNILHSKEIDGMSYEGIAMRDNAEGYKFFEKNNIVFTDTGLNPLFTLKTSSYKPLFNGLHKIMFYEKSAFHNTAFLIGNVDNKDRDLLPIEPNASDIFFLTTDTEGNFMVPNGSTLTMFDVYPNPARENIYIQYNLETSDFITIELYDILGKRITTIENTYKPLGTHIVGFDTLTLKDGVYTVKFSNGKNVQTKKLLID